MGVHRLHRVFLPITEDSRVRRQITVDLVENRTNNVNWIYLLAYIWYDTYKVTPNDNRNWWCN